MFVFSGNLVGLLHILPQIYWAATTPSHKNSRERNLLVVITTLCHLMSLCTGAFIVDKLEVSLPTLYPYPFETSTIISLKSLCWGFGSGALGSRGTFSTDDESNKSFRPLQSHSRNSSTRTSFFSNENVKGLKIVSFQFQ